MDNTKRKSLVNFNQKGFTMIEVMIASSILVGVMAIVLSFMRSSFENNQFVREQAIMKDAAQNTLYRISKDLAHSKRVYSNDAQGKTMINKLDMTTTEKGLLILPTIRSNGSLSQTRSCDTYPDEYFWPLSIGNSLYFVEFVGSQETFSGLSDPSLYEYKIPIYQFKVYFVDNSDDSDGKLDLWNDPPGMNPQHLIRWESKKYADYDAYISYMNYLDANGVAADKTAVKDELEDQGVEGLWDPKEDNPNDAFYNVAASLSPTKKSNSYKVQKLNSKRALLLPQKTSTMYSVAYNGNSDNSSAEFFPIKANVPKLYDSAPNPGAGTCGPNALPAAPPTIYNDSDNYQGPANAFPGGFEIGIVGPNSGRNIFINFTLVGRFKGKRMVEQHHVITAFARDF